MDKTTIIVDGAGVGATFNSVAITDINTVAFSPHGERDEINLTTLDEDDYEVGLLGDLVNIDDVIINKKADPAADIAHTKDNKALVISYKIGKATAKTATFWAQLKSVTPSTIERAPGDGINVDLAFAITNLNATLAETGPVLT